MTTSACASPAAALVPLVIDFDGTPIRTDLLHQPVVKLLRGRPHLSCVLPGRLAGGKSHLECQVANRVPLDIRGLPYNDALLHLRAQDIVARHLSRDEFAQPVCPPGHYDALPDMTTSVDGFFVAGTSCYNPEDRSTTESIRVGHEPAGRALACGRQTSVGGG